ncbi:response regulator [Bacterioplanoides sp.]|uniref:response regulator n=1 Tax=Bacterioplanoides sp. TaxID=2066072 RepID=UPI003B008DB1
MPPRILIVEDEPILALDLKEALQEMGYAIVGLCSSAQESIDLCRVLNPQLVLMDIKLEGEKTGTEAAKVISLELNIPVVFLTSYVDDDSIREAQAASSYGYLQKPFRQETLKATLALALTQHERQQQLSRELESLKRLPASDTVTTFWLSASTQYPLFSGALIRDGASVKLTPKEQKFLDTLALHADQPVSFEQLGLAVWNSADIKLSSLRTLLHRLRQKAGGAGAIQNILDSGYCLVSSEFAGES